ncbi:SDR family NAD(P)-dependent oxidoreductase [Yinghuangia seranimata]|uniref:SDR family NAD(P)-dependent oxidoreductase n=1 Tax=Yinghuangia seranimata TaxID=408067 RepID=UPI00248B06B8|nr:SDR family NAD(P)-dependent oxidoreductase [Yinghuangia seranimata]MDI2131466.1 SDR family NAD(P)-dependent oxidoreductase [Yinghuangia seranimata]
MPVALITGASRGLGLSLAHGLAQRGWTLVVTARGEDELAWAAEDLRTDGAEVTALPGDVADAAHRRELAAAVTRAGGLDLLVNNAGTLGVSPLPPLAEYPPAALEEVFRINTVAPLALVQLLLPTLAASGGTVVNVTSDASVESYEGWGGYGASKAALDHVTGTLAAENPGIRFYAVDPGDMRTAMHQEAFPGEDISDRPEPGTVVPALLELLDRQPVSGRYRASDFAVKTAV